MAAWETIRRALNSRWRVIGVAVVGALLVLLLWSIPKWQTNLTKGPWDATVRFDLENKARLTLAQIMGGLAILLGIWVTWRRVKATEDQVRVAQEQQITERYTRAVELLASDNLVAQLGAIYALERIARDSEGDHWTIVELLAAFVRNRASWTHADELAERKRRAGTGTHPPDSAYGDPPPLHVQACMDVIGRRSRWFGAGESNRLNLRSTLLRKGNFRSGHFEGADFLRANMEFADFRGAKLQGASFANAWLEGVFFQGAVLSGAKFQADSIRNADFSGADLSGVTGISQYDLDQTKGDASTVLPGGLTRPQCWLQK